METFASRIIDKFSNCGGVSLIADWLNIDRSNVYRWTYPKEKRGTGGIVPVRYWYPLIELARRCDIELSIEEFLGFTTDYHNHQKNHIA